MGVACVRFVSATTQMMLKFGPGMGRQAYEKRTRVRLGRRVGRTFLSAAALTDTRRKNGSARWSSSKGAFDSKDFHMNFEGLEFLGIFSMLIVSFII